MLMVQQLYCRRCGSADPPDCERWTSCLAREACAGRHPASCAGKQIRLAWKALYRRAHPGVRAYEYTSPRSQLLRNQCQRRNQPRCCSPMAHQTFEQVNGATQGLLDPSTCMNLTLIWHDVTFHEVDEAMERRMLAIARHISVLRAFCLGSSASFCTCLDSSWLLLCRSCFDFISFHRYGSIFPSRSPWKSMAESIYTFKG